jgi:predicted RNA-binding Zn ribbon-like protein
LNFSHFTDQPVQLAIDLVNTLHPVSAIDQLADAAALRAFLRAHDHDLAVRGGDLDRVRGLRAELREVFAAADPRVAADRINRLLERSGATPRVDAHDGRPHLHFEPGGAGLAERLGAATAMGLATVLCDFGVDRLGICASAGCQEAFVDRSKNRRKRYCSEACAHRESVAAFRARKLHSAQVREDSPTSRG